MSEDLDLDTRVSMALSHVSPSSDLPVRIAERTRVRAARRRAVLTGAAVAVAVVAVGSLAVVAGSRGSREADSVATGDVSATFRWEYLPDAPVPLREDAGAVWTGTEAVFWGGTSGSSARGGLRADGAAFDPAKRQWRLLPPAPIGPRSSPIAIWTGVEMLVWGGWRPLDHEDTGWADGAAYNPVTDTWRRIPDAPIDSHLGMGFAWTGTELIVIGDGSKGTVVTAYDPVRDSWRLLAGLSFRMNSAGWAAWTGEELLYWRPMAEFSADGFRPKLFAYDFEADRWTERDSPADDARFTWGDVSAVWTGNRFVVAGRTLLEDGEEASAIAYEPEHDRWRPVARVANHSLVVAGSAAAWNGHEIVLMWRTGFQASVLDPKTGAWEELPKTPGGLSQFATAATDGGDLYVFGADANVRLVREAG